MRFHKLLVLQLNWKQDGAYSSADEEEQADENEGVREKDAEGKIRDNEASVGELQT